MALAACASGPRTGVEHVVRPGETVYRISRYYGVSPDSVVRANRIRDVTQVGVGQSLFIPGAEKPQPSRALALAPVPRVASPAESRALARREADLVFAWPIQGRVSSGFGRRGGRAHEGIDIPAKKGTRVHAAEAGRVVYSGKLGGYGNVVIVKHSGRYSSVYAHHRRNRVAKGQFVEKGDVVGEVGRSGNAKGYHLHFEIRRDRRAADPRAYLP